MKLLQTFGSHTENLKIFAQEPRDQNNLFSVTHKFLAVR